MGGVGLAKRMATNKLDVVIVAWQQLEEQLKMFSEFQVGIKLLLCQANATAIELQELLYPLASNYLCIISYTGAFNLIPSFT